MQITIHHESITNVVYQAKVRKCSDISYTFNTLHNANKSDNINVSIQIISTMLKASQSNLMIITCNHPQFYNIRTLNRTTF
jgi:hypothetical protein